MIANMLSMESWKRPLALAGKGLIREFNGTKYNPLVSPFIQGKVSAQVMAIWLGVAASFGAIAVAFGAGYASAALLSAATFTVLPTIREMGDNPEFGGSHLFAVVGGGIAAAFGASYLTIAIMGMITFTGAYVGIHTLCLPMLVEHHAEKLLWELNSSPNTIFDTSARVKNLLLPTPTSDNPDFKAIFRKVVKRWLQYSLRDLNISAPYVLPKTYYQPSRHVGEKWVPGRTYLLDTRANALHYINEANPAPSTFLHWAAQLGDPLLLEQVQTLTNRHSLDTWANVDESERPAHTAAAYSSLEVLTDLLDNKKIDSYAASTPHKDIGEEDISDQEQKRSLIHAAVAYNKSEALALLLEHERVTNRSMNTRYINTKMYIKGESAFHCAVRRRKGESLRVLYEKARDELDISCNYIGSAAQQIHTVTLMLRAMQEANPARESLFNKVATDWITFMIDKGLDADQIAEIQDARNIPSALHAKMLSAIAQKSQVSE